MSTWLSVADAIGELSVCGAARGHTASINHTRPSPVHPSHWESSIHFPSSDGRRLLGLITEYVRDLLTVDCSIKKASTEHDIY